MDRMKLIALDQYLNIKLGRFLPGQTVPGETITERLAKAAAQGDAAGKKACEILDRIDPGHCARALRFPAMHGTDQE